LIVTVAATIAVGAAVGQVGKAAVKVVEKSVGKVVRKAAAKTVARSGATAASHLPRYNGPKPRYHRSDAHVAGRGMGIAQRKTPVPPDAESVYRTAVPDRPVDPKVWFGKNKQGQIYRFSPDNTGNVHFSGIDGVGDGVRNITDYARARLEAL